MNSDPDSSFHLAIIVLRIGVFLSLSAMCIIRSMSASSRRAATYFLAVMAFAIALGGVFDYMVELDLMSGDIASVIVTWNELLSSVFLLIASGGALMAAWKFYYRDLDEFD